MKKEYVFIREVNAYCHTLNVNALISSEGERRRKRPKKLECTGREKEKEKGKIGSKKTENERDLT